MIAWSESFLPVALVDVKHLLSDVYHNGSSMDTVSFSWHQQVPLFEEKDFFFSQQQRAEHSSSFSVSCCLCAAASILCVCVFSFI